MAKLRIDYLEKDLKQSIENDIKSIALYNSRSYRGIKAGFFSIPRHVFCIVDYLGYIDSSDHGSTKRAENFIKKYFPIRYHEYAELLVAMWRQGTVHQHQPKSYIAEYQGKSPKKIIINWLSNNSNKMINRKENLRTYSIEGKKTTKVYLVLNNCQLVDDLLEALSRFVSNAKNDRLKKQECEKRINAATREFPVSDIIGTNRQMTVVNQIKKAWKNRAGLINNEGTVVRRF